MLALTLIFLTSLHFTVLAYTPVEIMPTSQIIKGMKGVGKTVISGVTIEEFSIEVLGFLRESNQDLILVRLSGPLIEITGGLAAGMSGSPIYIDGKLIGAVSYGWSLTDHRLALVTPIERMLKVLNLNKQASESPKSIKVDLDLIKSDLSTSLGVEKRIVFSQPLKIEEQIYHQLYICQSSGEAQNLPLDNTLALYPVKTPLLVSGLNGRALERLMDDLEGFELIPLQTGSGDYPDHHLSPDLEPGSSICVQLVRGDIGVSTIGTVTYRRDNQILAFGHPFLNLGSVEYFLSSAEILAVVKSLDMPFKLGVPTGLQGMITEDRQGGLGGQLGLMPKIIPVNIQIEDFDLQNLQEYQFQIIRDEQIVLSLMMSSILQTIDTAIDRKGYGTSQVKLEIVADNLPNQLLRYENMYFSNHDIAADSLVDVRYLLDLLISNPFEQVNPVSIELLIQVEQNRQVALIEEVRLLNDQLSPGDTAEIEVTFRPFRAKPFKHLYQLELPEKLETGPATLSVASGFYGTSQAVDYQPPEREDESHFVEREYVKDLEEILEQYSKKPKNNQLVIEILPYYLQVMEDDQIVEAESDPDQTGGKNVKAVERLFNTDYVLEGGLTLEIEISELGDSVLEVTSEEITEESEKINSRMLKDREQV